MGRRLYVGNLPYTTGEAEREEAVQQSRHGGIRARHARRGSRAVRGLRLRRDGDR